MIRFSVRLLLYSLAVFVLFYFTESQLPQRFAFESFWLIQIFMIAVALVSHAGLEKARMKSNQHFIRQFMATTGLKLFFYMIVMVGYAVFNREAAVGFIVHFFMMYVFYTVFEIAFIYKRLSDR